MVDSKPAPPQRLVHKGQGRTLSPGDRGGDDTAIGCDLAGKMLGPAFLVHSVGDAPVGVKDMPESIAPGLGLPGHQPAGGVLEVVMTAVRVRDACQVIGRVDRQARAQPVGRDHRDRHAACVTLDGNPVTEASRPWAS